MLYLPEEEVQFVWGRMGENRTWKNFLKTVMQLCGKTRYLNNLMVDRLVREAYDLTQNNTSFPETPGRLYEFINARIEEESELV